MRLPSLFKSPSHQQFVYKPRFWNEKKEEIEQRIKEAEARQNGDLDAIKSSVSKTFKRGGGGNRNYMADSNYRVQQTRRSNMRLVIIIFALLFACYLLLR